MEKQNPNRITWKALDRFYFPKSSLWFMISIVIAALLALFAVFSKDSLMIIVFSLAIVMFFAAALKEPQELEISIDSAGIGKGEKFYPYSDFQSFWIFYNPPFNYILLKSKKMLSPKFKILLNEQNPVEIRAFLKSRLPEKEEKEGAIEIAERILRI